MARDDRYLDGLTRWTSKAVKQNPTDSWTSLAARVEFMRFDNRDENPEVSDLEVSGSKPQRLLRNDGGLPLLHPLSPCLIFDIEGNTAGSGT